MPPLWASAQSPVSAARVQPERGAFRC
jgi:hypothetical protein